MTAGRQTDIFVSLSALCLCKVQLVYCKYVGVLRYRRYEPDLIVIFKSQMKSLLFIDSLYTNAKLCRPLSEICKVQMAVAEKLADVVKLTVCVLVVVYGEC